jgi:Mechanosensitive ion channel, conserved TM helix
MSNFSDWFQQLQDAWRSTMATIVAYLPTVLGAIVLIIVGWLLARLARMLVVQLGGLINRALQNVTGVASLQRFRLAPQIIRIAGNAAYWLVILVFLTAAARTMELHEFSIWLARILNFVPVLLAGVLIIVAGYIASIFVRDVVSTALNTGGFRQGVLLGSIAQAAVLLTAVVIGVDQIGVNVSFLTTIIAIALGGVFGGFALAFGIGSRDFVSNIIAANDLQKHYHIGQTVRVNDAVGEIVELTPTNVIMATDQGRATVPAHIFQTSVSILMTPEPSHE